MRFNFVWQVALKEMWSTWRDKRTFNSTILMPIILIPVFVLGFPWLMGSMFSKETVSKQKVGIVGMQYLPEDLKNLLTRDQTQNGTVLQAGVELIAVQDAVKAVQDGTVEAALVLKQPLPKEAGGQPIPIEVYTKQSSMKSISVSNKIQGAITLWSSALVEEKLGGVGLKPEVLTPVAIQAKDASSKAESSAGALAFIIPMFLMQFILAGAQPTAIDSTAAEKERGTLEVLLVTPVKRIEVVMGKLLAVTLFSLISAVCGMLGLLISGWASKLIKLPSSNVPSSMGEEADFSQLGGNMSLDAGSFVALLAVALSIALLVSVVTLTISIYARSFKEAQTYLVPFGLVMVIPLIFLQFADFLTVTSGMYAIPLVNGMLSMLNIVKGKMDATGVSITVMSNVLYTALLVLVALRSFSREQVIFRN